MKYHVGSYFYAEAFPKAQHMPGEVVANSTYEPQLCTSKLLFQKYCSFIIQFNNP